MIFSLILVLLLSLVFLLAGRRITEPGTPLWIAGLAGLAVWMGAAWVFTLFGPLAFLAHTVVLALAVSGVIREWKYLFSGIRSETHGSAWLLWAAGAVFMVTYAADLPLVFDTGAYHLQVVRWLRTYGSVPGIANLDPHFGSASAWFSAVASMDVWLFNGRTSHFINAVPWLAGLAGALTGWYSWREDRTRYESLYAALVLPLYLYFHRTAGASQSPDLPAAIFGFAAVFCALRGLRLNQTGFLSLSALFAIAAAACKLSMAPLVLLPFALLIRPLPADLQARHWKLPLAAGLVAMAAFLAQNHLLSGWPLFPSTLWAGSSPDWQLPADDVSRLVYHVKMWGIRPDYQNLGNSGPAEWIITWFNRNRSIHYFPAEMYLLVLVPFSLIAGFRSTPATIRSRIYPVMVPVLTGLVYWFVSSPNPRFAPVWIYTAALLPLAPFCGSLAEKYGLLILKGIAFAGLLALLLFGMESGAKSRWFGHQSHLILTMRPAPEGPVVPFHTVDSTLVRIPEQGFRVFHAPLPAARSGRFCVERRGPGLNYGFRPAGQDCNPARPPENFR